MINTNVPTTYYSELITASVIGEQYVPDTNATINTRFNVMPTVVPASTKRHDTICVAIGNGGHKSDILTAVKENVVVHTPEDVSLYSFLPFVMKKLTEDISSVERQNYRFRVIHNINGVEYVAYYLRVVQLPAETTTTVTTYGTDLETKTTSLFTPSAANLNPTPPESPVGAGDYSMKQYSTTRYGDFVLDETDLSNIQDAALLLFGSVDYAIISELAVYNGISSTTTGIIKDTDGNESTITYDETTYTIPAYFTSVLFDTTLADGSLNMSVGVSSGVVYGS